MAIDIEVDGSYFTFPGDWAVEKVDAWTEQTRATKQPFTAKSCDIVAIHERDVWLIEAKDYTYPDASVPSDLHIEFAKKIWDTLALLHAIARWGSGDHRDFSRRALGGSKLSACLAMELPDGGRRKEGVAKPLADQLQLLAQVTRHIGLVRPVVSNSFIPRAVPWTVRRDPARRLLHQDR